MKSEMWKSNMVAALYSAITRNSEREKEMHGKDFESCQVAAWKILLEEIQKPEITGIQFFDAQ